MRNRARKGIPGRWNSVREGMYPMCASDNVGAALLTTSQLRLKWHGGVRLGRVWILGYDVEILFCC